MRENPEQNHSIRRLGRFAAATIALVATVGATLSVVTPADATVGVSARITDRWARSINVSSRSTVASGYRQSYAPNTGVSTGWSGNLLGCLLGWTSTRSNNATLRSINFVRSLNGLAPVRFSWAMNRNALRTALMMSANQTVSHYPTSGWRCYSAAGDRTAARSNLALAYPRITSGQVVDLYMDDRGSTNRAVGHRRWILNPFTTTMGNGSTANANALTVIGPSSSRRPNPRWVSWPSYGYFPYPLEPAGRWSLSSGLRSTNFAHARVQVWHGGHRLAVRKFRVENGYGMPTLVWQMPAQHRIGLYTVLVSGIHRNGSSRTFRHRYNVRIFHP